MVAIAKFASTVILYRLSDASETSKCDFEVFLIQRARGMKFLGGVHAFPGGKLEAEDYSEDSIARCKGLSKDQAHQIIQDKQTYHQDKNYSLGFWLTGIRELFEEVGILLAYDKESKLVNLSKPALQKKFEAYRKKLIKDEILFIDILKQEDLYYAADQLHYFRHFITPDLSPIRFDTRFFLAKCPPNQTLEPNPSEIIASEWGSPAGTLKRYRKKEIILIPPQYSCLSTLRKVSDIQKFCDSL